MICNIHHAGMVCVVGGGRAETINGVTGNGLEVSNRGSRISQVGPAGIFRSLRDYIMVYVVMYFTWVSRAKFVD